jgi:hypothetical protein
MAHYSGGILGVEQQRELLERMAHAGPPPVADAALRTLQDSG